MTGKRFSTWNWQGYAEYGWQWLKVYGAYSAIGEQQQIGTPFSGGPIYTQMVTRNFTRAGEDTLQLRVAADLGAAAPGLSVWFGLADGRNLVNAGSGAALPDEREYNVGAVWTYREWASMFDAMRLRLRYAWVFDYAPSDTQRGTDLRIDVNWPIPLL